MLVPPAIAPPVGKSGPGRCAIRPATSISGSSSAAMTAAFASRRLCGGIVHRAVHEQVRKARQLVGERRQTNLRVDGVHLQDAVDGTEVPVPVDQRIALPEVLGEPYQRLVARRVARDPDRRTYASPRRETPPAGDVEAVAEGRKLVRHASLGSAGCDAEPGQRKRPPFSRRQPWLTASRRTSGASAGSTRTPDIGPALDVLALARIV